MVPRQVSASEPVPQCAGGDSRWTQVGTVRGAEGHRVVWKPCTCLFTGWSPVFCDLLRGHVSPGPHGHRLG
jgi:hypothetical protein